MTSCINFEDHTLIKRWWGGKKINATSRKLKDKKKRVIVKNCFHLLQKVVSVFKFLEFIAT
jgi:hypothetical protein